MTVTALVLASLALAVDALLVFGLVLGKRKLQNIASTAFTDFSRILLTGNTANTGGVIAQTPVTAPQRTGPSSGDDGPGFVPLPTEATHPELRQPEGI